MRRTHLVVLCLLASACAFANEPVVGLPCEGCEAVFEGAPDKPAVKARIAPVGEPGEPLVLTGLVTGSDGKPRAGVIVYAYQTDAGGIYPRPAKSLGRWPDRHGRLRGWALTDANGRYTFETIRPGAYPERSVPQHIHMHVIEPRCATYYIDEVHFTDDPLLKPGTREDKRGGSGIVTPGRTDGVWQVTRDIRLGLNIPGYPGCKPAG
jgi:protocatechuate 3,4-dioxygenase beta subunit